MTDSSSGSTDDHPTQRLDAQSTQDLSAQPQPQRTGWTRQPMLVGAAVAVLLSGLVGVAVGFAMASDPAPASSTVQQSDADQQPGTGQFGDGTGPMGRHGSERGGHRGFDADGGAGQY